MSSFSSWPLPPTPWAGGGSSRPCPPGPAASCTRDDGVDDLNPLGGVVPRPLEAQAELGQDVDHGVPGQRPPCVPESRYGLLHQGVPLHPLKIYHQTCIEQKYGAFYSNSATKFKFCYLVLKSN